MYCGGEANEVDHVIARVNGGSNYEDNLVACCRRCNLAKGARRGVFSGRSDTPLCLGEVSPLKTVTETHVGPFAGQPKSDQTV